MADGNIPVDPKQNGWLTQLSAAISDITFPVVRKNIDHALGRIIGSSGNLIASTLTNAIEINEARKNIRIESITSIGHAANELNAEAEDVVQRSATYHARKTLREQQNRENIAQLTFDELLNTPPQEDAKKEIDDDWLENFSEKAQKISNKQMQHLWSKVLAGELKSPGSYSLRTVNFLSSISTIEANLIHSFFQFIFHPNIILFPDQLKEKRFDDLLKLEELGLINGIIGIGGLCLNHNLKGGNNEKQIIYSGQVGLLIHKKPDGNEKEELPCYVCSSTMIELSEISPTRPNDEHIKHIVDMLKNRNYRVSICHMQKKGEQITFSNVNEV